jgi:hypothetical protein
MLQLLFEHLLIYPNKIPKQMSRTQVSGNVLVKKTKLKATVIAEPAGFSKCMASGNSLNPESCFESQSKRSLRPSAPSLLSNKAAVM